MKHTLLWEAALAATLSLGWVCPARAQLTLRQHWPATNAPAAALDGGVRLQFDEAPGIVLHLPPLWVHSSQRGGQRVGHSGQLDRAGRTLIFRPTHDFMPGEVVYATSWAARAANLAPQPQLWQFTAAVGGTGQGNFSQPGVDVAAPTLAAGLALGDMDNDGDLDLVAASTSTQVSVRLNGGDATGGGAGQYGTAALVKVGHPTASLTLGDVDNDGDLDLVSGSDRAGWVSVRLNGGDASGSATGRFSGGSQLQLGACAALRVALGDVDGDGDLDLVAANDCSMGRVRVCLNGGDNRGTATGVFSFGSLVAVGSNPAALTLGDVDNDGDLDLLTANQAGSVSVRLNGGDATGGGTGRFGNGSEVAVGAGPTDLALADVDYDGDLDVLTANAAAGTVSVRLNGGDAAGTGTGRFGNGAEVKVAGQPQRLALADVDHDGDLDLVAACPQAGTVSIRLNGGDATGSHTGHFGQGSNFAAGAAPAGLALGDVDGDGDLDVLTTSAGQLSVRFNQPWLVAAAPETPICPPGTPVRPLLGNWLVQAYPNPSVEIPTLAISTSQGGPATVQLLDLQGQPLGQLQQLALSAGTTTLPLAAAQGLAPGVYLLRVQQGSQQQTIRLQRP